MRKKINKHAVFRRGSASKVHKIDSIKHNYFLKPNKISSRRELHTVQEHDREVTKKASETQDELKEALIESERNANLLAEYHELYELQRRRLEFQICM